MHPTSLAFTILHWMVSALALLITAVCSSIMATGEWLGSKHDRHL